MSGTFVGDHVVECFDQGDNNWLMNQVHVVLLWVENLELMAHWCFQEVV